MILNNVNQLLYWLRTKIEEYNCEIYNNSSFDWSRGYLKALRDVYEFINTLSNKTNK